MKFTEFLALSVDPQVRISLSALKTDVSSFFLPMILEIVIYHQPFLSFLTFWVT